MPMVHRENCQIVGEVLEAVVLAVAEVAFVADQIVEAEVRKLNKIYDLSYSLHSAKSQTKNNFCFKDQRTSTKSRNKLRWNLRRRRNRRTSELSKRLIWRLTSER